MAKVATSISIDADVKKQAQVLFSELGMDLSTAVNVFLKQSIRDSRIPFSIQCETPNDDTIAAMKECEEIEKHPEQYKRYKSFAEYRKDVEANV